MSCSSANDNDIPDFLRSYRYPLTLSHACRSGAPLEDIVRAYQKDPSQLFTCTQGYLSGTPLHEAIQCHKTSVESIKFLIRMLACRMDAEGGQNSLRNASSIIDEFGQFPLHLLVKRACYPSANDMRDDGIIDAIRELAMLFPPAVAAHSAYTDGRKNPLSIALCCTLGCDSRKTEKRIEAIVRILLRANPTAAAVGCSKEQVVIWSKRKSMPTPLHEAIVYCRSSSVIQMLLECAPQATLVPNELGQLPIHISIINETKPNTVRMILNVQPRAATVPDTMGRTALHWLWIRKVIETAIDVYSRNNMDHIMKLASLHYEDCSIKMINTIIEKGNASKQPPVIQLLGDRFWCDIQEFLFRAAPFRDQESFYNQVLIGNRKFWTGLAHAICSIRCPGAILLKLLLMLDPKLVTLKISDGRLPLHCAASTPRYFWVAHQTYVVDFLQPSLVDLLLRVFPLAAGVASNDYRLPLHIAIDSEKLWKNSRLPINAANDNQELWNYEAVVGGVLDKAYVFDPLGKDIEFIASNYYLSDDVTSILSAYPEAIERRDPKSMLYPFMQAAVGKDACINRIFQLLKQCPSLATLN